MHMKKDKKEISFKDLIPVDYTDGSWSDDDLGQLAYDYYKRVVGVVGEDAVAESVYDNMSKYELNAELRRLTAVIKKIENKDDHSDAEKKLLDRAKDSRNSIMAMLKEEDIVDDDTSEPLEEALNMIQRMKRRAIMRRNKSKILAGRRRAQRRRASGSVLQQRAMRAARASLARRMLRKDKGDASYSEKVRVEKALATRQGSIRNLARKMLSKIRQKEQERFHKHATPPKPISHV